MSSHSSRLNDSKLLHVIWDLGYSKDCAVITAIVTKWNKKLHSYTKHINEYPPDIFCLATGFLFCMDLFFYWFSSICLFPSLLQQYCQFPSNRDTIAISPKWVRCFGISRTTLTHQIFGCFPKSKSPVSVTPASKFIQMKLNTLPTLLLLSAGALKYSSKSSEVTMFFLLLF